MTNEFIKDLHILHGVDNLNLLFLSKRITYNVEPFNLDRSQFDKADLSA